MTMLKKLINEPMTYFVLLGSLIYYLYIPDVSEEDLIAATIELPSGFVAEQRLKFEKQYRRAPSDKELNGLLEQAVNDEILFREAWRLQLYVGDEVVRKRMIQKMRFILEDSGSPETIADDLVDQRIAKLKKEAEPNAQFSLYHLAFGDYENARAYLNVLESSSQNIVSDPEGVIAFPLGNAFAKISLKESERLFGRDFMANLKLNQQSQWQGPIKSRYGFHVVKLDNVQQSLVEDNEKTRETIRQDILRQKMQEKRRDAIENIKTRYVVAHTD